MNSTDPLRRWLIVFFVAIVLGGLAMLWWLIGGLGVRDYRIATKYREAQCRILDLRMEPSGVRSKLFAPFHRRGMEASPVFTFRFEVDGKTITTSGFDSLYGRDAKPADYSRFQVGETYPCWFDPDDPKNAVLVRQWRSSRYWASVVPLGFIFFALIFLRGITTTGGPAPTTMAPAQPCELPRNQPRLQWKFLLIGGAVAGLIALTVVVPIIAQKQERAAYPEIGAARYDGPALLEKLGLPPGVEVTGFRTIETPRARKRAWDAGAAWMAWTQPYATTRDYPSVATWYGEKLLADGWRVHHAADAAGAEFCRPEWRLSLKRTTVGYDLRLEWNKRFPTDECNHP